MTATPDNVLDYMETADYLIQQLRSNKAKINFNGHLGNGEDAVLFKDTAFAKNEARFDNVDWALLRTNDVFASWYTIMHQIGMSSNHIKAWHRGIETAYVPVADSDCHVCGERVSVCYNGSEFKFFHANAVGEEKSCRFSGGVKDYTVEIDVPSGRLVFANDFRSIMPNPEACDGHYINHEVGIVDTVLDTAKQGFLTAFVGNSCPAVHQEGNTIHVGSNGYNDEDEVIDPLGGEQRGSICTDLWWFYAVDGAAYDAVKKENKPDIEVEIQLEPGRYEMTVHPRGGHDFSKVERFATIKKI